MKQPAGATRAGSSPASGTLSTWGVNMAHLKQAVLVEKSSDFRMYQIRDVADPVITFSLPQDASRGAGRYRVQVALAEGQDHDDAVRLGVVTHVLRNASEDTAAMIASEDAKKWCQPQKMQEVLIKVLHFLCKAKMDGAAGISGMSVLCSVKGSKEQVLRALELLSSSQGSPVNRQDCGDNNVEEPTLADDDYDSNRTG